MNSRNSVSSRLKKELNNRWPAGARGARKTRNRLIKAMGGTPPAPPRKKPAPKKKAPAKKAQPARTPTVFPSSRAQRPIGIYYDELSRGINPFSEIETHGVADITDSAEHIAELFNRFGIVKLRRLYTPEKSRELWENCISFSGLEPLDYRAVFNKEKEWGTGGAPVLHDERFWPYVVEEKLKEVIQLLLGENTFEFGTAVAAHYSARGLHRDYRMLVEEDTPYNVHRPEKRIVRVLHYCGLNGGALGFIPFSHDEKKFAEESARVGSSYDTDWFNRHREVLTQARLKKNFVEADELERHVCWANADPGDVIISNSAMLHAGEYLTGPRYFFVSTYAESNEHTLPLTQELATTTKAREYYDFLVSHGFKGSTDVLAQGKLSEGSGAAAPAPDSMGGMGGS